MCASTLNYLDRQTLANASVRITTQFQLKQEHYGHLEFVFGWAFAAGSLVFGVLVDRFPVRWLYPIALFLWSAVGSATGWVRNYEELLICRGLLGFFEGGHWPCAIKTTQRLLESKDRSMGNSVLQGGTSIGAILAPLVMRALLTEQLESWRRAFQVVGALGLVWIVAWLWMVRSRDLSHSSENSRSITTTSANNPSVAADSASLWQLIWTRRMLTILLIVALINTSWQTLRAWLPKFLQNGRGYSESDALYLNALFFIATDIGCLGAGACTLFLGRRGWSVHRARLYTFGACAALASLTTLVAFLPKGPGLVCALLAVGAGTLGVFPIYHALTQDLSPVHQGKVTGFASIAAWLVGPPLQSLFGKLVDQTGSFDLGFGVAGWLCVVAWLILWRLWPDPGPDSNQRKKVYASS